ncbi:MAG: LacI family DNA-binding transcriptional regulator [Lachnospiraceae bacterium]|nr:LacI family DNA-binding transcriptional regulator [Lachnospiraceae bacterium]
MTAKELAKLLGVSQTAVSFALNGKDGVSTQTRNRIREAAQKYGFETPKETVANQSTGTIYLIYYQKSGMLFPILPFSTEVSEGVDAACAAAGYRVHILHVHHQEQLLQHLEEIGSSEKDGIILFGTDMVEEDFMPLAFQKAPMVMLDNHFISTKVDTVSINNIDSAYLATNYMIKKRLQMPGYLRSSYPIRNFDERREGFERALVHNGYSKSQYIHHELAASIDGAYADMLAILSGKEKLATCYFADNDSIALGAMKAFKEKGYRIPEDVAFIGFDDIELSEYTEPGLTTVHVPKRYMGMIAAQRLLSIIGKKDYYPVNIQITTNLVIRKSI